MEPIVIMSPRLSWLFLWLACCLPFLSWAQTDALRLTSSTEAPYFLPDKTGFLDRLIPEVFRRAGVAAVAVQYDAAARANINANSGVDDGVAIRSRDIGSQFPNLILVDEKVMDMEFVAFTLRKDLVINGFASLKPYTVGHITGWKVIEEGIPPGTAVSRAANADQLFQLLESGRVDLILFERWMGQRRLAERGLAAHALSPPLLSTGLYIHLHKKHAALVEPVKRALRTMKADGSLARLIAQTLASPAKVSTTQGPGTRSSACAVGLVAQDAS